MLSNIYRLMQNSTILTLHQLILHQLTQASVELHANCSPRTVNTSTTHNTIVAMDPIIVYKELFQFELQRDPSFNISNILIQTYEHAREKLMSTLDAMEDEPTHLPIAEDGDFDDLFGENDNDNLILDDITPDFLLKHDTKDAEIDLASYADMLHQLRLREKKFHKYDHSQLEKLSI